MTREEFVRIAQKYSPEVLEPAEPIEEAETVPPTAALQQFMAQYPSPFVAIAALVAEVMDDSMPDELRCQLTELLDSLSTLQGTKASR